MVVAAGAASLLVGLIGLGGQAISVANWPLAQKLGLQESTEDTEPLFRRLERNTALWDLVSWWTLPAAGALMLVGNAWWPLLAVFAGGIYFDTAGREIAKLGALEREGVQTGTQKDRRVRLCFFVVTAVVGMWVAALGAYQMLQ